MDKKEMPTGPLRAHPRGPMWPWGVELPAAPSGTRSGDSTAETAPLFPCLKPGLHHHHDLPPPWTDRSSWEAGPWRNKPLWAKGPGSLGVVVVVGRASQGTPRCQLFASNLSGLAWEMTPQRCSIPSLTVPDAKRI